MPKGVEHNILASPTPDFARVKVSSMPKGVEHNECQLRFALLMSEGIFDAERR